ncbi:MAG: DUF456 domain-containing protein [Duodenibacillus sp.]|nr:DUF456 domain-containing protein [Duodenibacillus sp.]
MPDAAELIASLPALAAYAGAAACILAGCAGTVVPGLPGLPLIFAGAALAGWAGGFEAIGYPTLILLAVLALAGMAVDWIAQAMGARKAGASRYGVLGALAGTVAGLFFGFVGIFFMPLVGAFAGELIARRDLAAAGNVGIATWLGMLAGTAVKVALAATMTGVTLAALLL